MNRPLKELIIQRGSNDHNLLKMYSLKDVEIIKIGSGFIQLKGKSKLYLQEKHEQEISVIPGGEGHRCMMSN